MRVESGQRLSFASRGAFLTVARVGQLSPQLARLAHTPTLRLFSTKATSQGEPAAEEKQDEPSKLDQMRQKLAQENPKLAQFTKAESKTCAATAPNEEQQSSEFTEEEWLKNYIGLENYAAIKAFQETPKEKKEAMARAPFTLSDFASGNFPEKYRGMVPAQEMEKLARIASARGKKTHPNFEFAYAAKFVISKPLMEQAHLAWLMEKQNPSQQGMEFRRQLFEQWGIAQTGSAPWDYMQPRLPEGKDGLVVSSMVKANVNPGNRHKYIPDWLVNMSGDGQAPAANHKYKKDGVARVSVNDYCSHITCGVCYTSTNKAGLSSERRLKREELSALIEHPEEGVKEIILSGGDFFSLRPLAQAMWLSVIGEAAKRAGKPVTVRFAGRQIIANPESAGPKFFAMLEWAKKTYPNSFNGFHIYTHTPHVSEVVKIAPDEKGIYRHVKDGDGRFVLRDDITAFLARVRQYNANPKNLPLQISMQTPMVLGVNDDSKVVADLIKLCSETGIRFQYLFGARKTIGYKFWQVPVIKAVQVKNAALSEFSSSGKGGVGPQIMQSTEHGKVEADVLYGRDESGKKTATHFLFRVNRAPGKEAEGFGETVIVGVTDENRGGHWFDDILAGGPIVHDGTGKFSPQTLAAGLAKAPKSAQAA